MFILYLLKYSFVIGYVLGLNRYWVLFFVEIKISSHWNKFYFTLKQILLHMNFVFLQFLKVYHIFTILIFFLRYFSKKPNNLTSSIFQLFYSFGSNCAQYLIGLTRQDIVWALYKYTLLLGFRLTSYWLLKLLTKILFFFINNLFIMIYKLVTIT